MTSSQGFDLIVIGAGPGGYTAAVRGAQLGLKVACIEKEPRLGGVCLNVGCIPSKALLDSSEYFHLAKTSFAEHGVKTGRVSLDLEAMMARKQKVVEDLTQQVQQLLDRHKIETIRGSARMSAPDSVSVALADGGTRDMTTKAVIIATGSTPMALPGLDFDGEMIVSSTEALSFDAVPKHLGIVGGGYIGLELGSVWRRLGAKVTVVEMLPKIGTGLDGQVGRTLQRTLKRQGFEFKLNSRVTEAKVAGKKVKITIATDDKQESLSVDRLLVSVGRRPLTDGLGLDDLGVARDEKSDQIIVDETYRTNVAGVYAIGDLIAGPMLAHKASAEGIAAAESIAGKPGDVNYDSIPSIIYTWPEVACVGLTEEQVKEREIPYDASTFPFAGVGRARCLGEASGFVKLISQAKSGRVLGVHIIGPRASDIIAECGLAMALGAGVEDIASTVHGHPTFAEGLQEAAMTALHK
jgi:dihydrolipoamide dehydrogenase